MGSQVIRKNDRLFDAFFLALIQTIKENENVLLLGRQAGERFTDHFCITNKIFNKINIDDLAKYIKLFIIQYISNINIHFTNNSIIFDKDSPIFYTPKTIQFICGILQATFEKLCNSPCNIRVIDNYTLSF